MLSDTSRDTAAAAASSGERRQSSFMNPYLAGVGLGLVLLTAFVVMGRGLGASGAFSSLDAWLLDGVASAHARGNEFFNGYLENGIGHPLKSWLVFEVLGVLVGAFLSGAFDHEEPHGGRPVCRRA